jgi:hypothetical protein
LGIGGGYNLHYQIRGAVNGTFGEFGFVADHEDVRLDHRIVGLILFGKKAYIQRGGENPAGLTNEKIGKLYENFPQYGLVFHRRGCHQEGFAVDEFIPFRALPFEVIGIGTIIVVIQ